MAYRSRKALLAFALLIALGWRSVAQAANAPHYERVRLVGNLDARTPAYNTYTKGAPIGQVSLTVIIRDHTNRLHRLELAIQKEVDINVWVYVLTPQTAETTILANATGFLVFSPRGKLTVAATYLVRARFSTASSLQFSLDFSRMTQLRRPTHLIQSAL